MVYSCDVRWYVSDVTIVSAGYMDLEHVRSTLLLGAQTDDRSV